MPAIRKAHLPYAHRSHGNPQQSLTQLATGQFKWPPLLLEVNGYNSQKDVTHGNHNATTSQVGQGWPVTV